MRFFFHHFYHTFAWTYDFVAALVSVGRWNTWIQAVIPFIHGKNVLEVGHGPGHLQELLINGQRFSVGLDESRQMGRLAKRRLEKAGHFKFNLIRARAESLPFANDTFDTVLSTSQPSIYSMYKHCQLSIAYSIRMDGWFSYHRPG